MGHPTLRKTARTVAVEKIRSKEMAKFVEDMIDSMYAHGGIGLAAPQVNRSIQLTVIDRGTRPREDVWVCFNPVITPLTDETQEIWEGCLSVPGLRGPVSRPRKVRVDHLDRMGIAQSVIVDGLFATVCQHEMDHLAGVLYIDRITDLRRLSYEEEYDQFWHSQPVAQEI